MRNSTYHASPSTVHKPKRLSASERREIQIQTLPSGVYIGDDGTLTLHNKRYEPIAQWVPGVGATPVGLKDWIAFPRENQVWFYDDRDLPMKPSLIRTVESVLSIFHEAGPHAPELIKAVATAVHGYRPSQAFTFLALTADHL